MTNFGCILKEQVFLEVLQNSEENTCARSSFLKLCNLHRKTLVLEPFFNKVADLHASNFIKKRLQYRCFPMNIVKFLKNTYFEEHLITLTASKHLLVFVID